ncbi:MAG: carbamoyltransferase N-terminal domain-containing protein [Fusobacterium sp.]
MGKIIVSVSRTFHDRSVTVMEDHKVKLILLEDRISRIKDDNIYPFLSILELPKVINKIDYLIINSTWDKNSEKEIIDYFYKLKLVPKHIEVFNSWGENHHKLHAASGFYGSGFKKAICLSIDGFGGSILLPKTKNVQGKFTTSIFESSYPNNFKLKYANLWYEPHFNDTFEECYNDNEIYDYNSNLDIGNIYEAVSRYLGFSNASEHGKTMGLASYGKEDKNIPPILYKNSLYGNANLFRSDKEIQTNLNPYLKIKNKNKAKNLAFLTQKAFNKVLINRVKQALNLSNTNNLVLSGGCALNVIGNYLIKKLYPNINLYIDPIANDACLSYGAAKYFYYKLNKSNISEPLKSLYCGPYYPKQKILSTINEYI